MPMKYKDKILPVFLEETKEHIDEVSNLLVQLEQKPTDQECLNEIFRLIHTLKGGAASVGFSTISDVAHKFENILDEVRNTHLQLTQEVFEVLFKTTDVLKSLLDAAVNGTKPEDIGELARQLNNISAPGSSCPPDEPAAKAIEKNLSCQVKLFENCLMKAPRVVVILKTLRRLGQVVETEPPEEQLLQGQFDDKFCIDIFSETSPQEIQQALAKTPDVEQVVITRLNGKETTLQDGDGASRHKDNQHIYVRVDVMKLENMINLIGELVIERNRMAALISEFQGEKEQDQILGHISAQLGRITAELQQEIMSSRMVPISQVFSNLPRLCRDTAKSLNKEIQLSILGEDTELDRTLVERLRDPMVHLLRNAIDHGIENPEQRRKVGKPRAGKIEISARQQDNNIIVDVTDDGKGINFHSVVQKVMSIGLKTAEEVELMSPEEVANLVFMPGFSTATTVSEISGRGVGLDAVRNEIELLNGSISVDSTQGVGTRFTIRLPLTLAIIQALLFSVDGREFALPLANIKETLSANQYQADVIHGSAVIKLRDRIIPLVSMAEFLGLPQQDDGGNYILVISDGDGMLGLQVDAMVGKKEIVIKPLGTFFAENRELVGVTLLGNGAIVPILDAGGIFRLTGNLYGDTNFNR